MLPNQAAKHFQAEHLKAIYNYPCSLNSTFLMSILCTERGPLGKTGNGNSECVTKTYTTMHIHNGAGSSLLNYCKAWASQHPNTSL